VKTTTLLTAILLLALARSAQADFVSTMTANSGFANSGAIPDGSMTGWSDTRTVSGIGNISDVSVTLNLSGGWNGDLYAYLVHGSGFSVLLNRVGRGTGNAPGYGAAGMNVTLNDAAGILANIHSVSVPTSGGTYQPDGRNISPLSSVATFHSASPSALLSSFNGLNPSGNWTLFIADVSGGDVSTVNGWSLQIASVPEPASLVEGSVAVLFLGGFIGLCRLKGPKVQPQSC
jgi:subtilisin-like proprotein convertase family protein